MNINLPFLKTISPFDKEPFQDLVSEDFPVPLNYPENQSKYSEFTSILNWKTKTTTKKNWLSLTNEEIEEVIKNVLKDRGKRLEMESSVIRRIIIHLILSKHVILVGPPGTGKTNSCSKIAKGTGD